MIVLWENIGDKEFATVYDDVEDMLKDMDEYWGDDHVMVEHPNGRLERVKVEPNASPRPENKTLLKVQRPDAKWIVAGRFPNPRHAQPHYQDFVEVLGRDRVRVV